MSTPPASPIPPLSPANDESPWREKKRDGKPQRETERARTLRERYARMAQPRSLALLAEQIVREQEAAAARAREERQPPPKVQTVASVLSYLGRLSSAFKWVEYANEQDRARIEQEAAQREQRLRQSFDLTAEAGRGAWVRAFGRLGALIDMDERVLNAWQAAVLAALQQGREPPERPRPLVSATALVAFGKLGLEAERLGLGAATQIIDDVAGAALPPVVEIEKDKHIPEEPRDLDDPSYGDPPDEVTPLSPRMKPALTSLTSAAPPEPSDDEDDEDDGEDDAGGWSDDEDDD